MRLSFHVPATLFVLLPLACAPTQGQPNDPSNPYGGNAYGAYPPGNAPPNAGYGNPATNPGYNNGAPGYNNSPPGYNNGTPGYNNSPPGYNTPPPGYNNTPGYNSGAPPAGGQATPVAPATAVAATPVLMGLGAQEAPGAQQDGGVFAGQFQEGQTLEQPINIQPGKCYTVVAAGVGVQQIDIQLIAQAVPMLPPTVLAQSNGGGATATLGGRATSCFKNPLPIGGPAKVVLKAARGGGTIAAQVYSK